MKWRADVEVEGKRFSVSVRAEADSEDMARQKIAVAVSRKFPNCAATVTGLRRDAGTDDVFGFLNNLFNGKNN